MFTSSHTRYRGTGRNDFPHEAICPHRFDISVAKEYLKGTKLFISLWVGIILFQDGARHAYDVNLIFKNTQAGPEGAGNPFCTKIFSGTTADVVARGYVNLDESERMAFRLEKDGGCIDNPLFNGTDLKFCYCNTDACNSSDIYRSSIPLLSTCVITSIIALNSLRR